MSLQLTIAKKMYCLYISSLFLSTQLTRSSITTNSRLKKLIIPEVIGTVHDGIEIKPLLCVPGVFTTSLLRAH